MDEYVHVRCITCNKVLGDKYGRYLEMLSEGVRIEDALYELGLTRPCCRLRVINPFKVPSKFGSRDEEKERKSNVRQQLESNLNELTVIGDSEAPTTGALSALSGITSDFMVTEEDESIMLPPVPELPSTSTSTKSIRRYDTN